MENRFDVVVIGGGTAGCVLAARLSENPRCKVALIEAGRDYSFGTEPASILDTFPTSFSDRRFLWPNLRVVEKATPGGAAKASNFVQARLLGGGSAIMGMHALRGLPSDFDEWRDAGAAGWSWQDVQPYFRKLQRDLDSEDPQEGGFGPIPIWRHDPVKWPPFARAVATALKARGFRQGADINAEVGDGLFPMSYNTLPSRRVTVADAYLSAEVRGRGNLHILSGSLALRFVFNGIATDSIEIETGKGHELIHGRQFVVSAGAIQSPTLLMRSGIGPADHLRSHDVDVMRDLPGVGSHLLNHPMLRLAARLRRGVRHPTDIRPHGNSALRYSSNYPGCPPGDMSLLILGKTAWHAVGASIAAFSASVYKAYSEGTLRLKGCKGENGPEVDFRLLSDERDLERMTDALAFSSALMSDAALAPLVTGTFLAGSSPWVARLSSLTWRNAAMSWVASAAMDLSPRIERALLGMVGQGLSDRVARDELRQIALSATTAMYHPAGTCRMGSPQNTLSVVGPDCRVVGVPNLYVADASIMPTIPSANTFLSTVMIGEKAADHLRMTALS